MSDTGNAIAYAITTSQILLDSFLKDISAEDYLHRPVAGANCAAWIVGHLVLTDRSVLGRLGMKDLPALPDGFEQRFARNERAPAAADYGEVSVLRPLWNRHRELLAQAVRNLPDAQFQQPLEQPRPLFKTVGEMAHFMAIHATMHAGQISTIRRSLGRPPLI
jgi:uncharacterized damage-inducible protein DinB